LQTLLAKHDIDYKGKALKMTGVTEAFNADTTEMEVVYSGRWRTSHIPM
jgi:hypothetical protein